MLLIELQLLLILWFRYIQKSGVSPSLGPQRAQLTVALSCVLYLPSSLDLVDPRCTEYEIRSRIGQGFHDLHLYANDYWLDHLQALLDSPVGTYSNEADLAPLREALERLAITHNELAALKGWKFKNENDLALSPGGNIWRSTLISPAVKRLLDDTLAYRKDALVNDGLNASSDCKSSTSRYLHPFNTDLSIGRLRQRYRPYVVLHHSNAVPKHCGRDLGK